MDKRLYRSTSEKKIAGVCGGIAEYFGIDPTVVRLIWVIFAFCGGSGVVAYLIALAIMPLPPVSGRDNEYLK